MEGSEQQNRQQRERERENTLLHMSALVVPMGTCAASTPWDVTCTV